ncbi:hypothetical protein V6Z12_A13G165300 [Gossypium hirsutum]
MKIALFTKNKHGYVDGTYLRVDLPTGLHPQWDCCNAIFLSWILNIVCQELSVGIVFASSACLVWKDLQEHYSKVDGSKIYYLHHTISSHTQVDPVIPSSIQAPSAPTLTSEQY